MALATTHRVVEHKPIEQKNYWEENQIFEGVEKHNLSVNTTTLQGIVLGGEESKRSLFAVFVINLTQHYITGSKAKVIRVCEVVIVLSNIMSCEIM